MAALTEFVQDGIRYIPTKTIAKAVGLSPRYVADFCRNSADQLKPKCFT